MRYRYETKDVNFIFKLIHIFFFSSAFFIYVISDLPLAILQLIYVKIKKIFLFLLFLFIFSSFIFL